MISSWEVIEGRISLSTNEYGLWVNKETHSIHPEKIKREYTRSIIHCRNIHTILTSRDEVEGERIQVK